MKLFSISSRALCTCINKHKNVINARIIISDTNIHERGINRGNEDMQQEPTVIPFSVDAAESKIHWQPSWM